MRLQFGCTKQSKFYVMSAGRDLHRSTDAVCSLTFRLYLQMPKGDKGDAMQQNAMMTIIMIELCHDKSITKIF